MYNFIAWVWLTLVSSYVVYAIYIENVGHMVVSVTFLIITCLVSGMNIGY